MGIQGSVDFAQRRPRERVETTGPVAPNATPDEGQARDQQESRVSDEVGWKSEGGVAGVKLTSRRPPLEITGVSVLSGSIT